MGLAPYLDKAALAASHVLSGFDYNTFVAHLGAMKVAVAFDASAAEASEGSVALDLITNLLARFYPRISLVALGGGCDVKIAELRRNAHLINPNIEIDEDVTTAGGIVVVGQTGIPESEGRVVHIGSDGWVGYVSSRHPVPVGTSGNPFGPAAASCLGAANIFRLLFAGQLERAGLDEDLSFSTLACETGSKENAPLPEVDLGTSFLVGCGAIGNGAVWTMSRLSKVSGQLHLVDHETIDTTNPQRYVLAGPSDEGIYKVDVAARHLKSTRLNVTANRQRWGDFLRARESWALDRVTVALDSAKDRRAVQSSLPRWIVNAWTQPGDIGVSRHAFDDDFACLCCLYLPTGTTKNEDELVAEALGLKSELMLVRKLLDSNAPVAHNLLERIASALAVPIEGLKQFDGRPIRDLVSEGLCGGVILRLKGGSDGSARAEVPLAFQSALAGILLAAELVIQAVGLRKSPPPVTSRLNLLQPIQRVVNMRERKDPSGHCICQDPDFLRVYRSKYPSHPQSMSAS